MYMVFGACRCSIVALIKHVITPPPPLPPTSSQEYRMYTIQPETRRRTSEHNVLASNKVISVDPFSSVECMCYIHTVNLYKTGQVSMIYKRRT